MIQVHDVAWPDLKARIAKVIGGEWRKKDGFWNLVRPDPLARIQRKAVVDGRLRAIRADIDKLKRVEPWSQSYLVATLAKISSLAENESKALAESRSRRLGELTDSSSMSPAGRALRRLLAEMNPEEIASIEPDSMAVYSSRPTQVERPLPSGSDRVLDQFLAEQREFVAGVEHGTDLFPAIEFLDPRYNLSSTYAQASRFVVTVRRFGQGGPEVSLVAADPDGWQVASAHVRLELPSGAQTPISEVPATPLVFSQRAEDFKSIYTVVSGRFGGDLGDRDAARSLAIKWMPAFIDSVHVDPMSFIVGEALGQSAQAMKANLVADLPDTMLTFMPMSSSNKKYTARDFISELSGSWSNTWIRHSDGWLEIGTVDPLSATANRLNRTALGKLATTIDEKKRADVDDLGDYAAQQPGNLCFNSIDQAYAAVFSPHSGDSGAGLANYYFANVLRFWGSLSKAQRDSLRRGESVELGQLPPDARKWLERYVYGIPRVFATNFETPFSVPPTSPDRRNIRASPYEGLGNGLSNATTITGEPITSTFLQVNVKGQEFVDSEAPDVLGYWFADQGWPLSGEQSPLLSVAYTDVPMLTVRFDFGGGYKAWAQIGDDASTWSMPGAYSTLPERIRKEVEARYEQQKARKAENEAKAKTRKIPPR